MKNNQYLLIVLLCCLVTPLYAGVDQVYGKKTNWWTQAYDGLMSHLGIGKSYALVIGVGQYNDNTFATLPSEKDAVRIKNYLINEAGFDHVHLVTGEKVTIRKIREYMLDYYPKKLLRNDRFLFYWSGHGVTGGQKMRKIGYLALKKSNANNFSSMISMRNISQWDMGINAKQTLYLLDACFSGIAASRAMSVRKEQTIERVNRPSRQVLTAGLENQQTLVISDIGGGVFTRALLDGLRGHADTDKGPFKKDGVVTTRELEEYIRERVNHERRRVGWNKAITPQLYSFSDSAGDFFFISDKRIVKPHALTYGKSHVVTTGVEIKHDPIRLEVIDDRGKIFQQKKLNNKYKAYIKAERGKRFSLRIRNMSNKTIGVLVSIDGYNILTKRKSLVKYTESMFVLDPYSVSIIRGWRTGKNKISRFFFTGKGSSYATSKGGRASDIGVIALAVFNNGGSSFFRAKQVPIRKYYYKYMWKF